MSSTSPFDAVTTSSEPKVAPGSLRIVMYHYVRAYDPDFPKLRFLDVADFKKQLDYFQTIYNFPTREEVLTYASTADPRQLCREKPNMLLTFDDGLLDHYVYVLPELKRRGLWGIFYVPSGPCDSGIILDVHKIHALTARFDSNVLLRRAEELISCKQNAIYAEKRAEFEKHTYRRDFQTNDEATTKFKRLCNYFLRPEVRTQLLRQMLLECFMDECQLQQSWYMNSEQLKIMHEAGMWIGAHSVTHSVLGSLSVVEQRHEIASSFEFIERVIGEKYPRTFCYPYGGPVSHSIDTIKILTELNCLFTVDVNYRDCDSEIIAKHAQELPRWDCNKFFSGSCRNTYTREEVLHDYGRPSALITKARPRFRYSKITLFTGHQPRHLALIHRLADITDTLYVVQEVAGSVSTRQESGDALETYFTKVHEAEQKYFGGIRFTPANVRTMSMLSGDASAVPLETYGTALDAEVFVVFGASFLKGALGRFLEQRRAINCHIGLSPYYRGSATTFWAVYDENYAHNGATIHHLTSKLDGGDIICHCLPTMQGVENGFEFTMKTVKVTHDALIEILSNGDIWRWMWQPQDPELKMRYCRKNDFTAEVARSWLDVQPTSKYISEKLSSCVLPTSLIRPFYG